MIPLTPGQRVLVVVLLLAGAAAAGALVNGWRLDGDCQRDLAARDKTISELRASIQTQNAAVQAMGIQSAEADKRRQTAETFARAALMSIDKRAAAVRASAAPDCAALLRESWGQP